MAVVADPNFVFTTPPDPTPSGAKVADANFVLPPPPPPPPPGPQVAGPAPAPIVTSSEVSFTAPAASSAPAASAAAVETAFTAPAAPTGGGESAAPASSFSIADMFGGASPPPASTPAITSVQADFLLGWAMFNDPSFVEGDYAGVQRKAPLDWLTF
jgi:hypothetical protein